MKINFGSIPQNAVCLIIENMELDRPQEFENQAKPLLKKSECPQNCNIEKPPKLKSRPKSARKISGN